ncbi:DUF4097 domain-containing protein [Ectobacillus sp. JY-23]|uniref:DUF4097 family beta strand repeat-containing protein n=1 Tax=Ectobacillus sp. JY-23 TaxID=2933872 RepID=UPI001FF6F6B2|nr:DUF4097 family beta strand repeat-containing protein [Ectobacillus sp. JY-23]UOY91643.1 DUF4097 domain-containing protein [Ectobacillus sp. JY-23]
MLKKIALAAVIITTVGIVGLTTTAFTQDGILWENVMGKQYTFDENKSAEAEKVQKIQVEVGSADITVKQGAGDQIKVRLHGEGNKKGIQKMKLELVEDNDALKIRTKSNHFGWFTYINAKLDVIVPEKLYDQIVVESGSGNITVENVKSKQIEVEASSGDLHVSRLTAETINLHVSSGDIYGERLTGEVKTESSSGDTFLKLTEVAHNINLDSSSGDIEVTIEKEPTNMALDFKSSSGDGRVSIPMNYEEKTSDEIRGKVGAGTHQMQVRISSGDFTLHTN